MHSIATLIAIAGVATSVLGGVVGTRQSCPAIHIFGARETTAPAGYGTGGKFVNLILGAYPGSTAEAINYPAQGGSAYGSSVQTGTQNIANQINSFNKRCPNSKLVVVGYSQGAQIGDNAICGGGGASLTAAAGSAVKAIIWAGNPRNSPAEKRAFGHGTCNASGFAARASTAGCGAYQSRIRSYCDAADPYCCNGKDAATHQGYGTEYGQDALAFVKSKLG